MPSEKQRATMKVYAGILGEARSRLEMLESLFNGVYPIPPIAVREFSFLQLRMLCELIALGCLAAHGDIAETHTKRFREEWSAEKILRGLERLHPMFFPEAMEQLPGDGAMKSRLKSASNFLTKPELVQLYNKCGEALHKGTIARLTKRPADRNPDNSDVVQWTTKAHRLLGIHSIHLFDGSAYMISYLRSASSGKAGVAFAEVV